jgi:hypothetical protein
MIFIKRINSISDCFFKDRQFLIKGIYRLKIIEVGLKGGIDYKTLAENIPFSEIKAQVKQLK